MRGVKTMAIKRTQTIMDNVKKMRDSARRSIGSPAKEYYNEILARKSVAERYGDNLFSIGTNVYVSGTPLYMEVFGQSGLLLGNDKPRTSDYILCAKDYQIKGHEIKIDDETIKKLTESIKDIATSEETEKFNGLFEKLADKNTSEEARKALWKIVDSDKSRFTELEKSLMNADVRRSRSILLNTLGEGSVDMENIRQALMEVNRKISDMEIRHDVKMEMLKEIDDIYMYCRKKTDRVNKTVSLQDWNDRYKEVEMRELGAERLRFDEMIRKETEKAFSLNLSQPEMILIARKDLEEHINQSLKGVPEKLQSFFEDFYEKLRHCVETTDREISQEALKDDANKVPFIVHSAVFTNDEADSYEATFTVSDGQNCWCESARMNKEGDVSISSATINAQGIVDSLNVERRDDIAQERIEIHEAKQETKEKIEIEEAVTRTSFYGPEM